MMKPDIKVKALYEHFILMILYLRPWALKVANMYVIFTLINKTTVCSTHPTNNHSCDMKKWVSLIVFVPTEKMFFRSELYFSILSFVRSTYCWNLHM